MKKYFNLELFKACLLKMGGILIACAAICFTNNLAVFLETFIVYFTDGENNLNMISLFEETALGFAYPTGIILAFTPFIALSAFSYLNKKNATDFYHSLGHSRLCIFISFVSACLYAIFTLVILFTVIPVFLHAALLGVPFASEEFAEAMTYMSNGAPIFLIAILFIFSLFLLARMLTGKGGSAFFLGIILCTLPLYIASATIWINNKILSSYIYNFKFNGEVAGDMIIAITFAAASFIPIPTIRDFVGSISGLITKPQSASLYLFIPLSLAIIVLSAYIYTRRKSERSSMNFVSPAASVLFRLGLILPISYALINKTVEYEFTAIFLDGFVSELITVLLLAILIWYISTLILTRSVKRTFKSVSVLVTIPFLVILPVVVPILMNSYVNSLIPKVPDREDVVSVSFTTGYIEENTYSDPLENDIYFFDNELIDELHLSARNTVMWLKGNNRTPLRSYPKSTVTFRLKNGRKYTMYCALTDKLATPAGLMEYDEFSNTFLSIPEEAPDRISLSFERSGYSANLSNLTSLYETVRKEYNELPLDRKKYCLVTTYTDDIAPKLILYYGDKRFTVAIISDLTDSLNEMNKIALSDNGSDAHEQIRAEIFRLSLSSEAASSTQLKLRLRSFSVPVFDYSLPKDTASNYADIFATLLTDSSFANYSFEDGSPLLYIKLNGNGCYFPVSESTLRRVRDLAYKSAPRNDYYYSW